VRPSVTDAVTVPSIFIPSGLPLEVPQRFQQQARARQQDQRPADLRRHQNLPQPVSPGRRGAPGRQRLQPRPRQRRSEPEEKPAQQRHARRKQQHPRVHAGLAQTRNIRGRNRGQHPQQAECQRRSRRPAAQRQQRALGEGLPRQTPPPRPQRQPHREVPLARRPSGKQQVGHVRARDQHHRENRRQQHPRSGLRVQNLPVADTADPKRDVLAEVRRHGLHRLVEQGPQGGRGLGWIDSSFQPPDAV
jgi:hypothetical protein